MNSIGKHCRKNDLNVRLECSLILLLDFLDESDFRALNSKTTKSKAMIAALAIEMIGDFPEDDSKADTITV